MLSGIAWRNVWRNRKRSLIMIGAIAIGLSGGLFASGIMIGMAESMVNTAIDRSLGHVQIHTPAFRADPRISDSIPGAGELMATLKATRGVRGVTGRTIVDGMASSAASNTGVRIVGIDPGEESSVTAIGGRIIEGKYLDSDGRLPVCVGRKLKEKLGLRIHSKVVLSFAGSDGTIVYGAFRIVGVFETESTQFDRGTLFVRRQDLAGLLGNGTLIHEIAVRLDGADRVPGVVSSLRRDHPALAVESWKDLAPELKLTAEMTDISMLFFLAIILAGLLFGITNTMLMSVLDRVREFGVLMAIGMQRRRVFVLILFETCFLSLVGGLLGVIVGAMAVGITGRTGIDLSVVAEGLSSYGISAMLFPTVPASLYGELGILVIITALCAAVYPGMKATRLNPATSIRTYA